jgi:2-methylcitrate dehydratase
MSTSSAAAADRSGDPIQDHLARHAMAMRRERLPPEVVHAATALIIDTLGVLVAAYPCEPCRIARELAAAAPCERGATIVGGRLRTSVEIAAFVNATTARYAEANDVYARHLPGHMHGHPSDVVLPLLAVAEQRRASGRAFVASVVLAYEVYLWLCDVSRSGGFDPATFGSPAVAMGAGLLLGLDEARMRHAIAMAVVPNNMLKQVRADQLSAWKAAAAGQAGRAGVFAAELARIGMPGPNLPFVGTSGWCEHVAGARFSAEGLAPDRFRILGARMKPRPARALTIPAIQAAERVHVHVPAERIGDVAQVRVEVHQQAAHGTHAEHWHPDSRETADHSIPFGVAAALVDGRVSVRSFDQSRLRDRRLLELIGKMQIVPNDEFSAAFSGQPQHYCARVTVRFNDGACFSAGSGRDDDDLAAPKRDAWVNEKFRGMIEGLIDRPRGEALLERLWRIAAAPDLADLPAAFALE